MPAGVEKFAKFAPDKKADYLQKLREGVSPCTAARAVGVSRQLVRLYRKDHPDFAAEERLAVRESHEQVENALFKAALDGNVTACQVWLYNRLPDRWKDRRNQTFAGVDLDELIRRELERLAGAGQGPPVPPPPGDADAGGGTPGVAGRVAG